MLRNKKFLWLLIIINVFIFMVGFWLDDMNLMILALLSYASLFVGLFFTEEKDVK